MAISGTREGLISLYRRLAPVMRTERKLYLLGIFFTFLSIGTTLAFPQVIRIIVDDAILGDRLSIITPLAFLMACLLIIESYSISKFFQLFGRAARRNVEALRLQLVEHLVEQETAFFDRESSSKLMARLMGDVGQVNSLLAGLIPSAIQQFFFFVVGTGLVIYTSPPLALVIVVFLPPIGYGASKLGERGRKAAHDLQNSESLVAQAALETLASIRTVRAYARERFEVKRFGGFIDASIQNAQRGIKASARVQGFARLSGEAAVVVGIWAGGQLIIAGYLTAGALVSFILYAGLVARATRNLSEFSAEALRIHGTTEMIFSYLDRETKMPLRGGLRPESVEGRIEFENVSFHYGEDDGSVDHPHGLQSINLRIERGEEIAIVGPSGSGKSTLVQLVIRFYDPDSGVVRLDGVDLQELDPSWVREQMTYVSQDSSLFSRTLEENLQYSGDDATDEDVAKAVDLVGATSLIASQPEGYQTEVGDQGARLSGGQRQRIALARALIAQPAVLILDEATSALDSESESGIKESLRNLEFSPTVIWIAHRLSTVIDVDRILVVDRGRIVADGCHAELLRTSANYRELVETQLVGE
ncbi:MAG: ABC transporter ATP-binding protein [Myxococcota bacterium]|nr:ABC transporter ATP-binding protein [Myxococcota bacterium]